MVKFCYFQEEDGFLSLPKYDHWHEVLSKLKKITEGITMVDAKELSPNFYSMITYFNDVNNNEKMLILAVSKAELMFKK